MISLGKIFKKNTSFLRRLKLVYVVNNLLNSKRLQHNRLLYPKYGLKRSIYSPIGSQSFKEKSSDIPWLDQPNSKEKLLQHPRFSDFSKDMQEQLIQFEEEGYMVLKGFYSAEEVATHNAEIERLLNEGIVDFNYTGRKIMEAYKYSTILDQKFFRNPALLDLLSFLFGRKSLPFHTINFIEGSEQRAHSDFIHMSTEPQGYLVAAWTALEDCSEDNGTLFYYPKSHRLPYITCQDYPSGNSRWLIGNYSNRNFEDKIESILEEAGLEKKYFSGHAGDVFIWHANLIHGGGPIQRQGATRKSMVAHYFAEGVICYHEMSQRPAFFDPVQKH